jgi:cytochrome c oxidase subunit 5a
MAAVRARIPARSVAAFSTSRQLASEHAEETFEEFTSRVENDFNAVNDVFELQVSC